jgi:N-acetylglutamate synthase
MTNAGQQTITCAAPPHVTRAVADQALARRVEEASLNAWPAMAQLLLDGWLLRFARGFTKRANSVTPLYPGHEPLERKIRACENLYARERLKTIFRITSIGDSAELDGMLASRGYEYLDPTEVLCAELEPEPAMPEIEPMPLDAWLDTYARLTGLPRDAQGLHAAILRAIPLPCCYAVIGNGAPPVACGLAVLEHELLGLFDVVTAPEARRAGHGRALVTGLLAWGARHGARRAYLQMVADNVPAAGLYAGLGFARLYRYWYRVSR